jgi:hypothetical protein
MKLSMCIFSVPISLKQLLYTFREGIYDFLSSEKKHWTNFVVSHRLLEDLNHRSLEGLM